VLVAPDMRTWDVAWAVGSCQGRTAGTAGMGTLRGILGRRSACSGRKIS